MCYQRYVTKEGIPVGCGVCYECKKKIVSHWATRMFFESRASKVCHFVTLTYAPKYLPCNKAQRTYGTLNKKDVQLFIKRVRKAVAGNAKSNIKYFAVGEYGGGVTMRPHYHLLIWNANEVAIRKSWDYGFVNCSVNEGHAARYCMKYIMKPAKITSLDKYGRLPEFRIMSNGIGDSYITAKRILYHWDDVTGRYCVKLPGKRGQTPITVSMPRYYADRIYRAQDKLLIKCVAIANEEKLIQQMLDYADKYGYNSYKQLVKDYQAKGNQQIIIETKNRKTHETVNC